MVFDDSANRIQASSDTRWTSEIVNKDSFGCTGQATRGWHPPTGELPAHSCPGDGAPTRGGQAYWPLGATGNLHLRSVMIKKVKKATKIKILF
jgi:hypothetical protein